MTRIFAACVALAALLLVLAWNDVLPGGWTLRGLVRPHAERAADEHARHVGARLAMFARERVEPGSIVFLGASTVERWPLDRSFPSARALNRGISGAFARELEAHVEALVPMDAAAVILQAGGNDRIAAPEAPLEIAARVARLVDRIRERAPRAELAVLGLLPQRAMKEAHVLALARLNAELESACRARGTSFVPLARSPLRDERGALAERFSVDSLHLDPAGYALVSTWLVEEGGAAGRILVR